MENFKRDIFEMMGNLFYAIAKDQHVAELEFGELKMIMRKDWLTDPAHKSGNLVSEASHLIVLTMDNLQTDKIPAERAFNAFTRFYNAHREQFSDALKEKIVATALDITDVFPAKDRRKNNHVLKLKLLFQNSGLVV